LKQIETTVDIGDLFSGSTQGGSALTNAVSGNLKDKTGFKGAINTNETAREKLLNYVEGMEHSKVYIPIAEDFNNLMRPEIQSELYKALGKDAFIELLESMQIILTKQNPYQQNQAINKTVNAMVNWGVLGTLAWKIGSVPKQAVAFTNLMNAALEDGINAVDFVSAYTAITNKSEREAVYKFLNSNWIQERFKEGGIDMETRRVFNNMKKSKAHNFMGQAMDKGMFPIKAGDYGSVLLGSVPLMVAYYRKGISKGMTIDEAYEWAYFNASDKSERVLQSSNEDKTSLGQKTQLGRLLYTFKSAQVAMMTKTVDAGRKLRSGQKLSKEEKRQALWDLMYYPLANASFTAVSSKVIISAAQGIISRFLNGEDASEEDKEEALKALTELGLGTLSSDLQGFGASGLIADQLLNKVTGQDWKNNLPIARFGGTFIDGLSTLGYVISGGNWDSLTDKEKKSIASLAMIKNLVDAKSDWEEVFDGDQDALDAVMNWNEYDDNKQKSLWERWKEDETSSSSDNSRNGSSRGGSRGDSRGSSGGGR